MNLEKITSPSQEITERHVPSVKLCRFFKKQEYADFFDKGEYRFGNLKCYRGAELDVRSDPTESESQNYANDGSMYGSWSSGNYYALCFTELNEDTKVQELAGKFGELEKPAIQLIVEDNIYLTQAILNAWGNSKDKYRSAYFQWFKVIYNKNEIGDFKPLENNQDLHIYQKPKFHKTHQLKRIHKSPPPPICVDLGGDIGTVLKFSDLSQRAEYNSLKTDKDWKEIEPEINNFETEKEWRLVFFSGDGFNKSTNKHFTLLTHRTKVNEKS